MSTSFADLKRSRPSIEELTNQVNKSLGTNQSQQNGPDDRIWKPTVDKAGNGYAIIRFLPAPSGEDVPFVRVWDHGFQGPTGQWYIESSLTTIGEKDPVSEYNSQLWNSGIESNKDQVRKQKRRLSFYSNIYVVKDPGNPDNEGKVFLYKYGKKIFDKLNTLMNPEFEGDEPVNPFDFWEGANFKLKIRQVGGYRNYDSSEFDRSSALKDDDGELEAIWKSQYGLQDFVDPKNFKPYDELKAKLYRVLALDAGAAIATGSTDTFAEEADTFSRQPVAAAPELPSTPSPTSAEDDDDLEFFKNLANED
jgi:hypothetical protein